jgi:hypothetical protein
VHLGVASGNHLHRCLVLSAKGAGLRRLHHAGSEDNFSVCKNVLVGKMGGQLKDDARFPNNSNVLEFYSGGEGGTRTPDPAIMSRVL